MQAPLCQSNFLSQRCNGESMRTRLKSSCFLQLLVFCGYVFVMWGWNESLLRSSRVVSLSLESLLCILLYFFFVHIQFYSHLPPFSTLPLTLSLLVSHSHLLSVIVWALCLLGHLEYSPYMVPLLTAGHLCPLLNPRTYCSCPLLPLCVTPQVSRSHLPDSNPPEAWPEITPSVCRLPCSRGGR